MQHSTGNLSGMYILRRDTQLRGTVTVDALISNVCCSGDLGHVAELFNVRTDRTSNNVTATTTEGSTV